MTTPNEHRGVIAWFTRNTVAANLLMWLIVVSGLMMLPVIKKEVFPEIAAQTIAVTVAYPGATPDEVEYSICQRIEEAVQGLTGVKRITSRAAENGGAVNVELLPGIEASAMLNDVKTRVDAIDTFPDESEKPIVQEVVLRRQVLNIAISGDLDERALKNVGQQVRDELARLPDITQVELVSVRPDEISIEVAEEALRRFGIGFDTVAAAVRRSSLDLPGGSLKTTGGEILLRTAGQARSREEFERIVVLRRPDGTTVELGAVATVTDGFADADTAARFDGEPAVMVQVYRVGDQSALDISGAARAYVATKQAELPDGVTLTPWRDETVILNSRIDLLVRNAATGLLLVFCVLALFLRFRLAFWVSLGIPISFLGAIALMPTFGVSINMVSLFAFILVLGIVVDDAIVVGESVFKQLRGGASGVEAAIRGSKLVALPVVFGVMTTVAAFTPLLDVDTNARDLWRHVPLIVIPCLAFSLIESKLILPAHLSHERADGEARPRRGIGRAFAVVGRAWGALQRPLSRGLESFVDRVYRPVLAVCLRWRYLTWSTGIGTLLITLTLVAGGWIRFDFFPAVEGDNVVASVVLPLGTPAADTRAVLRQLETAATTLGDDLEREHGAPVFRHVLTSIGEQPYQLDMARNAGVMADAQSGSHLGEINVQMVASEEREISAEEVQRRWRALAGDIVDRYEIAFTSTIVRAGPDIDVQLAAGDIATLRAAADRLKAALASYDGVVDIADSLRAGKPELRFELLPRADALGLTLSDVARQVRQGFYGEEAQRLQRGRDDIKVMVRYPADARRSVADLDDMRIRTATGDAVPLSTVARLRRDRGLSTITRTDLARTVNVTAAIDAQRANTNQIVAELQAHAIPALLAEFPDLTADFEGDASEQQRTLASLLRGAIVALIAIYALMAIPFRSYTQPLMVMAVIPFGLVGAIWGHVFMGMELSIVSMLGLVALTGVVVNDSLVLVDYVNQRRREGHGRVAAVHQAGAARFRPILLTSLTTFASLTPMLLERSVQAQFLMPMAVSLAFGVLFATLITLILVPSGYLILEDLRAGVRWLVRDPTNEQQRDRAPVAKAC